MHLQEGVLSAPVLIAGGVAAAAGTYLGLRQLNDERLPRVGVMASALFIASLVHLPIGVASVHLVLNGLAGLLLGWAVFPAFLVSLFLQAILLKFGGLTTLGVNTVLMAGPGVLVHYVFRRRVMQSSRAALAGGGAACGLAVIISAGLLFAALVATGRGFLLTAEVVLAAHAPVAAVEALVGGLCVRYLYAVRPEMLAWKTEIQR